MLVAFEHSDQHLMDPNLGDSGAAGNKPIGLADGPTANRNCAAAPGVWRLLADSHSTRRSARKHIAPPSRVMSIIVRTRVSSARHLKTVVGVRWSAISVLSVCFDQDEHLDALMNFVKGVTEGIGFDAGDRILETPGQYLTGSR